MIQNRLRFRAFRLQFWQSENVKLERHCLRSLHFRNNRKMSSFSFLSEEEQKAWTEISEFEKLSLKNRSKQKGKPSEEEIKEIRVHRSRRKEFLASLSEEKRQKLVDKKPPQKKKQTKKAFDPEVHKNQLEALRKFSIQDKELVDIGINLHGRSSYPAIVRYFERALAAGVTRVILTGCSLESSRQGVEVCEKWYSSGDYEKIPVKVYHTVGVHPHDAKTLVNSENVIDAEKWNTLLSIAKSPFMVSIGECGLDYDRMFSPMEVQKHVFKEQVKIAAEMGQPLFVHLRDRDADKGPPLGALEDASKILESQINPAIVPSKVCVHCFTGDTDELKALSSKGYLVGFTGYLGMQKRASATGTLEALASSGNIPLDQILIETDAPFMKPDKLWFPDDVGLKKASQNEPASMPAVCRALAKVYDKGTKTESEIAEQTTKNASTFFNFCEIDAKISKLK